VQAISILAWLALSATAVFPAAATQKIVEKRVNVAEGVALRAVEAGAPNAAPEIIFIPGWSAGADIWRGQIDRFGDRGRVIAFDPRSQGESTKTTTGNTPERRAADLHALLDAEHVRRPVLVGWSQAAQDLAAYVLKYGTRDLAGIVLVDAAVAEGAKGIAARPEQASRQFSYFARYTADQEAYVRGMFDAIISKPQPKGMIDHYVATAMKTPPSIGIAMLVADMFGNDRTPALARIDCPVLIIAATSSEELARQKAEAKEIKDARFVQIDDAAHAVFLDQPEQFGQALAAFLTEIDSKRSHKLVPRQ
jgi:microsomal epoxide hydrolase